jgi:hypothetical protein
MALRRGIGMGRVGRVQRRFKRNKMRPFWGFKIFSVIKSIPLFLYLFVPPRFFHPFDGWPFYLHFFIEFYLQDFFILSTYIFIFSSFRLLTLYLHFFTSKTLSSFRRMNGEPLDMASEPMVIINRWSSGRLSYRGRYSVRGPYLYGSPPPDACGTDEQIRVLSLTEGAGGAGGAGGAEEAEETEETPYGEPDGEPDVYADFKSPVLYHLATCRSTTSVTIDWGCQPAGFAEFTDILRSTTRWTDLNLRCNLCPDSPDNKENALLVKLCRALRQNRSLKSLTLVINLVTPLAPLQAVLAEHPTLTRLSFEGYMNVEQGHAIVDLSRVNTRLRSLNLDGMGVEPMNPAVKTAMLRSIRENLERVAERRRAFKTFLLCLQARTAENTLSRLSVDLLMIIQRFTLN